MSCGPRRPAAERQQPQGRSPRHTARRRPAPATCCGSSAGWSRRPGAKTSYRGPRRASAPRRGRSQPRRPAAIPAQVRLSPDNTPGRSRRRAAARPCGCASCSAFFHIFLSAEKQKHSALSDCYIEKQYITPDKTTR